MDDDIDIPDEVEELLENIPDDEVEEMEAEREEMNQKQSELSPDDCASELVDAQPMTPPGLTDERDRDEPLPTIQELAEMDEDGVSEVIESRGLPPVENVLKVARDIAGVDEPIDGMQMFG